MSWLLVRVRGLLYFLLYKVLSLRIPSKLALCSVRLIFWFMEKVNTYNIFTHFTVR